MIPSDGFAPDRVRLGLFVSDVAELFRVVADDLLEAGLIGDAADAFRALVAREAVHSTALGAGVALPHARPSSCRTPRLLAARLAMALDFGAPDGIPVDLAFVLLSPPDDPAAHVKEIGRIARALGRDGVVEALRRAPDEDAFRKVLGGAVVAA